MPICVYFQQGRCRYGDRCKNEHPGNFTTGASANRFSVLGTGTSAAGNAVANRGSSLCYIDHASGNIQRQQDKSDNFHVSAEGIQLDLTAGKERPGWIFSAYGPGKNAPRQLFGGPSREQSFEEMRLRHYEAAAAGNANVAIQESQRLHDETLNQIQTILNDLNGAVKYVLDGLNEHPNRIDICEGKKAIPSAFTQQTAVPSAPGTAFGKPSALGTTAPAASFGKPSMFGAAQNKPAFGQPSFGKPSFGQPSLGQPSFGQPSFGQPAFGRPSMPGGSTTANPSPFAQASQPNPLAAGRFNQPLAPSPFGQAAIGQATTSPFSSIASQSAGTSVFGAPSSTAVVSEQPSQTPSAFGQRQPAPQPSPFGPTTTVAATPSVFGQPTSTTAAPVQPTTNVTARAPLGPKPIIQVGPGELNPIPDLAGATVRDPMTQRIIRWKGRPVEYKDGVPRYLHPSDNKTWVRIFFYDGPPELATLRDCSDRDENYTQEVIAQYQYFVQNGVFKDGIVPSVPPKTEWVSFDF